MKAIYERISAASALFCVVVGGVALSGWLLHIEAFKRIAPGLVAMNPLTCVCFILAGITIFIFENDRLDRRWCHIARLCALGVFLVGVLKLCDILFGTHIAIDQWLFSDQLSFPAGSRPNRMAPNTAFNLFLSGIALFLANKKTKDGWRPAQIFAFIIILDALLVLAGYIWGVQFFYVVGSFFPMAVHTAVAFLVLGIGLLFLESKRVSRADELLVQRVMLGYGFGIAFLALIATVSYQSVLMLAENERWVSHTHEVLVSLQRVRSDLMQAESQRRGYALLKDPQILQEYLDAIKRVEPDFERLKKLTGDNVEQQRNIVSLWPLIEEKKNQFRTSMENELKGTAPLQSRVDSTARGIRIMHDIENVLRRIEEVETTLLRQREVSADSVVNHTLNIVMIGGAAALIIAFLSSFYVRSDLARRLASEHELRDNAAVQDLTNKIAVAANDLKTVDEVLRTVLEEICHYISWPIGHVHWVENGTTLVPSKLWYLEDEGRYEEFRQLTERSAFIGSTSLVARVLKKGSALWVAESEGPTAFPVEKRAHGLRSGVALPVISGERVAAILEFFSPEVVPMNKKWIDILSHVGVQLGRIFDRAQAEALLKASEARTCLIVDTAHDAFIGINEASEVLDWNRQAEITFCVPREQALGKKLPNLIFREQDRPEQFDRVRRFLQSGDQTVLNQRVELIAMRQTGEEFPIETTVSPIRLGTGYYFAVFLRDITERKRAEERNKAALAEKELLLKEIHHRVKNNMQVISSLLQLQSGYIKEPQFRAMFAESQDRIKSMALIHEKLYQSHDLARIDFGEYIRSLVRMISRSYPTKTGPVVVEVKAETTFLNIDTGVPVGLILNELLSNTFKHGFPDDRKGKIEISLGSHAGGGFELLIKDDGVGLPADFTMDSTKSLGLRLVNILTEQISGSLAFQSQNGAEFRLTFREVKV